MDGFHALGTQGRSHPRQRQDPEEEKLLKSCLMARLTAKLIILQQLVGWLVVSWS